MEKNFSDDKLRKAHEQQGKSQKKH